MNWRTISIVAILAAALAGCSPQLRQDGDVLFQTSTINALMDGVFDGNMTLSELQQHGDFGVGTFDAMDGEMVLLDGCVYQCRADGRAYRPSPKMTTPFATVTFFASDRTFEPGQSLNLGQLAAAIDQAAPNKNIPVAFRVTGMFKRVKVRSVPKQYKPYPRLVDVAAKQPVFEFRDLSGVLVGFRSPEYFKGINIAGYHLHFITSQRTAGGHVLEVETANVQVELDGKSAIFINLPRSEAFEKANLAGDTTAEIKRVEK